MHIDATQRLLLVALLWRSILLLLLQRLLLQHDSCEPYFAALCCNIHDRNSRQCTIGDVAASACQAAAWYPTCVAAAHAATYAWHRTSV